MGCRYRHVLAFVVHICDDMYISDSFILKCEASLWFSYSNCICINVP